MGRRKKQQDQPATEATDAPAGEAANGAAGPAVDPGPGEPPTAEVPPADVSDPPFALGEAEAVDVGSQDMRPRHLQQREADRVFPEAPSMPRGA